MHHSLQIMFTIYICLPGKDRGQGMLLVYFNREYPHPELIAAIADIEHDYLVIG